MNVNIIREASSVERRKSWLFDIKQKTDSFVCERR